MFEWLVDTGASWLAGAIGAALTAIVGGAIALVRRKSTRAEINALKNEVKTTKQEQIVAINALRQALRASLYDRLYYLHSKFMQQGWISVQDLENITGIYEGYHGLGANGVGTKLYNDLCTLPNFESM